MSTLNQARKVVQELEQLTDQAQNAVRIWEWSDRETAEGGRAQIDPDLTTELTGLVAARLTVLRLISSITKKVSDASDADIQAL